MIYKDDDSQYDLEFMPAVRDEDCLNCGQEHNDHDGWRCYNVPAVLYKDGSASGNFGDYLPTDKYLTKSMKDSIMPNISNSKNNEFDEGKTKSFLDCFGTDIHHKYHLDELDCKILSPEFNLGTAKPTIDQWQAWAHNQPGDCACGIKREACDYHR